VEAQAAGLPCIFSDFITPEVDICGEMLCRVPQKESAEEWAGAIDRTLTRVTERTRAAAFATVEGSRFNLARSLNELENYYIRLCEEHCGPAQLRDTAITPSGS
jgi:hypothetical protein